MYIKKTKMKYLIHIGNYTKNTMHNNIDRHTMLEEVSTIITMPV